MSLKKSNTNILLEIEEVMTELIGYKKRELESLRKKTGVDKMENEIERMEKIHASLHSVTSEEFVIDDRNVGDDNSLSLYLRFYKHRGDIPDDVKQFIETACRRHAVNEGQLKAYIDELDEKARV